MPELDLGSVVGPQGNQGEIGPPGKQGIQGEPGPAATINGVNTLTITAGDNVTLKQEGSALEIGAVVPGKNLLLNWDFRNPVNRNGKAEYTVVRYTIDRWRLNLSTYNAYTMILSPEGYVELHQNINDTSSIIEQHVKSDASMLGKTVTFSVLTADMGCISKTVTLTTTPSYVYFVAGSSANGYASIQFVSDQNTIQFIIGSGKGTRKIVAAKLELGTQQTLARQNEDGEWEIIDPPDYDLQYALCSLYIPSTGEWVGYQHSNPNLLDNWYFVDPVNQRGQTEYTTSAVSIYTLDRWALSGSSSANAKLEVVDGGVRITSANAFRQTAEDSVTKSLVGKIVTVSALMDVEVPPQSGQIGIVADNAWIGSMPLPKTAGTDILVSATISVGNVSKLTPWIYSAAGGIYKLKAMKLELGSVQTLAHKEGDTWVLNDPPPNKALELAKCQRYQLVLPGTSAKYPLLGVGNCAASGRCAIIISTPVSMRVKPAAVYTDLNGFVLGQDKVSDQSLNVTNISVGDSLSKNSVYLNVYADGLTIGKTYIFTGNSRRTSQLVLDANL